MGALSSGVLDFGVSHLPCIVRPDEILGLPSTSAMPQQDHRSQKCCSPVQSSTGPKCRVPVPLPPLEYLSHAS
jgi:hypothetical protein